MKRLTLRQKLITAVLVIVLLGWLIDSLSDGKPRKASAASPAPPGPLVTSPSGDVDALFTRIDEVRAARGLRDADLGRDLFRPNDAVYRTADQAAVAPPPVDADELFKSTHQLSGVIVGAVPIAVIEGDLLRVGAVLDGYELLEILPDKAVFSREGRKIILPLHERPPAPRNH